MHLVRPIGQLSENTVAKYKHTPAMYYDIADTSHPPLFIAEEAFVIKFAFSNGEKGVLQDTSAVKRHNETFGRSNRDFTGARMKAVMEKYFKCRTGPGLALGPWPS